MHTWKYCDYFGLEPRGQNFENMIHTYVVKIWFTRMLWSGDGWSMIRISSCDGWISAVGEVASHFVYFTSLLSFALSGRIQSKLCYREEFDRCKIHRMDNSCLELTWYLWGICGSCAANGGSATMNSWDYPDEIAVGEVLLRNYELDSVTVSLVD